jgi:pimeloyl-ACP methyl ester carboxylesterase
MVITTLLQAANRVFFGPIPEGPSDGSEAGLVLMADGVGGLDLCGRSLSHMVARAELPLRVRLFSWGHGFGRWYADLTDVAQHRERARGLADEIRRYREQNPENPVYLVAKSGGCGLAAWALERLPPNTVEKAVLLAPALSPRYNLAPALRAVRSEMVVFWSPYDFFILGLGTLLFKTIDRERACGAGQQSFQPTGDPAALSKLRQVRWRPSMMRCGYFGGHVGPDNPIFLRDFVVPLLDSPLSSDSLVEQLLESSQARPRPIT